MKLLKIFLLIIVILGLVFFLTLNNETTKVNLIYEQYITSVYVVILISGAVGLLAGFLLAVSSILATKNSARLIRQKNKKLTEELNQLRNVNIEDDALIPDTDKEA